jgi:DUF4097 and DUF4098 domain-containing protein YvlB
MEHVRTIDREYDTGEHAVLHVEGRSGAIMVEGTDSASVRVEATVRIWSDVAAEADDAAAQVEASMQQDGNRVIIRAPSLPQGGHGWGSLFGLRGSRVDYVVRVPRRSAVRVLSRSGRVAVSRIEGRVHSEVMSGRCEIEDVTGDVTVVSRSGTLTIDQVDGNVTAEARSGKVRVRRVAGNASVEARSGAVEAAEITGTLRASARTGSVNIDTALSDVQASSRCGPVRYRGPVQGDFNIEVGTGPINLEVDAERPFFIDAESSLGPVTSSLPPRRGSSAPSEGGPKVRLRTRTGPITISKLD